MNERTVFIVSDRTGITAETMSHSLLSQFPGMRFRTVALPYVDTDDKVNDAVRQIDRAAESGQKPLIFTTFVDDSRRARLQAANAVSFDLFEAFIGPLEQELGMPSSHSVGQTHGLVDAGRYTSRISAVNFSVHCDDGLHPVDYNRAAVVLIGVSRSGKTPTCLYLALHFGVFAANYPLTEDDFVKRGLPEVLEPCRKKLFGLTIDARQLHQIRRERRANSRYAALAQCRREIEAARSMFEAQRIAYVDTTAMSIEEIATTILQKKGISREHY